MNNITLENKTKKEVYNLGGGGGDTAIYGLYRYVPLFFKQFTLG